MLDRVPECVFMISAMYPDIYIFQNGGYLISFSFYMKATGIIAEIRKQDHAGWCSHSGKQCGVS